MDEFLRAQEGYVKILQKISDMTEDASKLRSEL